MMIRSMLPGKGATSWRTVGAVLLAAVCIVSVQAKNPPASDKGQDVEFKQLIDRYCADWSVLDPGKAAELYAKDADLIFYDVAPFEYHGWSEYYDGVKKAFFDRMTSGTLSHKDDLKVTRRGKVAWTTVSLHVAITWKDGKTEAFDARHTAIWERRGNQWLIVHEHISAPLPGS